MPYIVTTRTQDPTASYPREAPLLVDRRAVATLDEARREITRVVDDIEVREPWQYSDEAKALADSGGTIGPLPDGSVVDVKQVSWPYLQAGRTRSSDHATVIDAYNAAQA